ncbi:hypothetical protein ZIOFF_029055 [Zingiber officinale]|uniref:NADP-dependent oxidoreductase domain-containing protein n=1 Tax=Zingiber officinale TaxID=94328 RepID=A0A8J5GW18_ZINOF|nr:hypothetical protein ZIOFF_029055 [Zingiber officinale]
MATLERRELGNTGFKLSCVGFGASPLGKVFGDVSHEDALAAVRLALQSGINFFDTSPLASLSPSLKKGAAFISYPCRISPFFARFYGGTLSETVLGNCLSELKVPREEFIVSTKCGRYKDGFDFSAQRVTRSIDESLARLKLDYVDILHCHDIEFGSLDQIVNETIPALQKIKESGKARFIGITGLPLGIFTYVLDRVPPGSVDVVLSYCHYGINDSTLVDLLPYLKSKGVGVITASPLAMGLLTDVGPPEWHPAPSELKALRFIPKPGSPPLLVMHTSRSADRFIQHPYYKLNPSFIGTSLSLAAHCKEKGKNISKIALQYSLMNKEIATVLVGMNSSKQVEENLAAAVELSSLGIDEDLLHEVEAVLQPVKNLTWPSGIQQKPNPA